MKTNIIKERISGIMNILKAPRKGGKRIGIKDVKNTVEEKREKKNRILKERRDNREVTLINFTFDRENNEYIWDEKTHVKMKDVPHKAVHVTGKKRMYFDTDLWDELQWPGKGQSAVHMYLWMINESINPEALSEQKPKHADIDWQKLLIYGIVGVVGIFVIMGFIR